MMVILKGAALRRIDISLLETDINSELRNEQIRPLFLSHFFIKNSQTFNPVVTASLTVSTINDAVNRGPITSAGILDLHSAPLPMIGHALKLEMKIQR